MIRHGKEVTMYSVKAAEISDISDFRRREQERTDKGKKRIRTADDRFAALDKENQRSVICHMIGYMEALNDNILSGKRMRTNEVSQIFESMEKVINKKWNRRVRRGGTVSDGELKETQTANYFSKFCPIDCAVLPANA